MARRKKSKLELELEAWGELKGKAGKVARLLILERALNNAYIALRPKGGRSPEISVTIMSEFSELYRKADILRLASRAFDLVARELRALGCRVSRNFKTHRYANVEFVTLKANADLRRANFGDIHERLKGVRGQLGPRRKRKYDKERTKKRRAASRQKKG